MARALDHKHTVPLEEVVLGQSVELEPLLKVLKRKGVISKVKVLEDLKQPRKQPARPR